MIEGFAVQPCPLWAVLVLPGEWEPIMCRVVGWHRMAGARPGELRPVLAWGAGTMTPREEDSVDYFDSPAEAERRSAIIAEAFRRRDQEHLEGWSPGDGGPARAVAAVTVGARQNSPMAENSQPRKVGRPRVGTGAVGDRAASVQKSIIYAPDHMPRLKDAAAQLVTSRNRLVVRALCETLKKHGGKQKPPIPLPPTGGMKCQRQYIPESEEQEAAVAKLAATWGVTGHDVRRIAVELLLVELGYPPLPVAESTTAEEG